MAKIDIIVPAYNAQHTIIRCMDSILRQTSKDIKVIAIDDRSEDNTLPLLEQYQERYSNVKVICNQQNEGVSYTRNRGLDHSDGQYVMFVDADDYLDSDLLEKILSLKEYDVVETLLILEYFTRSNKLLQFTESKIKPQISEKSKEEILRSFDCLRYACGVLYKREVIGTTRFQEDMKSYEDNLFTSSLRIKMNSYCKAPFCGYHYTQKPNGQTCDRDQTDYIKCAKYLKELYANYKDIQTTLDATIISNILAILFTGKIAVMNVSSAAKEKCVDEMVKAIEDVCPNWVEKNSLLYHMISSKSARKIAANYHGTVNSPALFFHIENLMNPYRPSAKILKK